VKRCQSFAAAIVIALGLGVATPAAAQVQKPVQFAKGASSATLKGQIKGDQYVDYLVRAAAGQKMTVTFKPTNASAYFNVLPPGSDEAIFIGSSSGNTFAGTIKDSGEHVIRVYLMRNAARRNELANYTLAVAVTGALPATQSHDALVPGTSFHATAQVPCTMAPGQPAGRCAAGVIRRGGGDATVQITMPTGGDRHIYFKSGRADSSDAGATPMQVIRDGDTNVIRIGKEYYEIPDALVVGG
jgi:hypothetical protein